MKIKVSADPRLRPMEACAKNEAGEVIGFTIEGFIGTQVFAHWPETKEIVLSTEMHKRFVDFTQRQGPPQ
jgi:hypothetical protein